jgi:DNA repair protein RadD
LFPGKTHAVICDHAGNALRLSTLPDDDRQWTLEGRKRGKRAANGPSDALPIRQCLECYMVSPSSADHCPGCGVVFPARAASGVPAEGELFELTRLNAKRGSRSSGRPKSAPAVARGLDAARQEARGYKNGWAIYQWKLRQRWRRPA